MVNSDIKIYDECLNKNYGRLGIAFFYDDQGIVGEYYFHFLKEISKFTERNVFVSNGDIREQDKARLVEMNFEIVLRDNVGFDVWAYKAAIEYVGYDALKNYSEIILFNHTFYGPIYPLEEMFSSMADRSCGFWGITAHKEVVPNPFTNEGVLPRHLNSHFIAVRRSLAMSQVFHDYWQKMPMINSYFDSILTHESRFTKHFQDLEATCLVYDDDTKYSSAYPCFTNVDETLENRCPILKRRIFFHNPIEHESRAVDLPLALKIMRQTSDYDESMIWTDILRTADLRTLNTTCALTYVLPDTRMKISDKTEKAPLGKIAVCLHVYYVEMMDELLGLAQNINRPIDLVITTDSEKKRQEIENICRTWGRAEKVNVIVMDQNRGRDMGALFITCRDIFLSDEYDLVLRLHSKKSPQVESSRSNIFKRHMFENLANSPGYVDNILDMFEEKPWVGLAVPPAVHISYATLGHGWFTNKPLAEKLAKELDIRVKLDVHTPVAAYGTMFWFRPKAVRKLFDRAWAWTDFNQEPNHVDGGLAHVLERLLAYTVQDAGYLTVQVASQEQASYNYAMLEFKFAELSSSISARFQDQVWMMQKWAASGHALPGPTYQVMSRDSYAFRAKWHEDESILEHISPAKARSYVDQFRDARKSWEHPLDIDRVVGSIAEGKSTFDQDYETIFEYLSAVDPVNFIGVSGQNLVNKIKEYLLFGWSKGQDIFVFFDTSYYLRNNLDVARSNFNPFVHYIRHGRFEGRQPHPLFDAAYYARGRGVKLSDDEDAVRVFLNAPIDSLNSPHPLFDMDLYKNWYPDVAAHGQNSLSHYIRHGGSERRKPHALFDQDFYEDGLGTRLPVDINPLIHYLEVGGPEGVDVHPLFDGKHYIKTAPGDIGGIDPLLHYLTAKNADCGQPHPLFDAFWYASQYGVIRFPMNALEHYIKSGPSKPQSAHPLFNGAAYLKAYPEVLTAGIDPLVHYLKHGFVEHRKVPGFSEDLIPSIRELSYNDKFEPFVYYLKYLHGKRVPA